MNSLLKFGLNYMVGDNISLTGAEGDAVDGGAAHPETGHRVSVLGVEHHQVSVTCARGHHHRVRVERQ